MGVDFECINCTFSCSYGHWNYIRCYLIRTTSLYIRAVIGSIAEQNYNKIGTAEFDKVAHSIYNTLLTHSNYILGLKDGQTSLNEESESKNDELVALLTSLNQSVEYYDGLLQINLGGIIALCNKSDCEGYYTPGNSLDIVILLDIIKPYIEYDSLFCIEYFNQLYEMFEESVKQKHRVLIF
jgi:hypothetical protein